MDKLYIISPYILTLWYSFIIKKKFGPASQPSLMPLSLPLLLYLPCFLPSYLHSYLPSYLPSWVCSFFSLFLPHSHYLYLTVFLCLTVPISLTSSFPPLLYSSSTPPFLFTCPSKEGRGVFKLNISLIWGKSISCFLLSKCGLPMQCRLYLCIR